MMFRDAYRILSDVSWTRKRSLHAQLPQLDVLTGPYHFQRSVALVAVVGV